MRIQPRFGSDPIIQLDGDPTEVRTPFLRQRRRLLDAFANLSEDQLAQPSRCEGWSARDVAAHLASVDTFWGYSISKGRKGQPTQALVDFDPTATPAALVAATSAMSGAETVAMLSTSTERLLALVESLEEPDWMLAAEGPPGHISISAVVHHGLWDAWIHERDVLLPLGQTPPELDDEIIASLRYVSGLGAGFAISQGKPRVGHLGVKVTNPEAAFVVEIADGAVVRAGQDGANFTLIGDAVALLEALSVRAPLPLAVPAEHAWMVQGLAEAFA